MNSKTVLAVALGAAAMIGQAKAVQINGTIDFSSISTKEVTLMGANSFLTATGLDFPAGPNAQTDGATGAFIGELGDTATLNDEVFSSALTPAWTTTSGHFSFDLNAGYSVIRGAHFLTVDGNGTAHDLFGVMDDTPGRFTFTTQGTPSANRTTFSWSATTDTNPTPVPDGGATAILLGAGLLGLGACSLRKGSNIA